MPRMEISKGSSFGVMKVVSEATAKTTTTLSGRKRSYRYFNMSCKCGKLFKVALSELRRGQYSCGCERGTHKSHKTRLYRCWQSMLQRSKRRGDSCLIYDGWKDFRKFEKWSLENGYKSSLVLCRNGDKGNYEPNNCRWDTRGNNVKEALSKNFLVKDTDGVYSLIKNMREYCRDSGKSRECIVRVLSGKRRTYKGCRYFKTIPVNFIN